MCQVLRTDVDHVVTLTLNRPEKLNAITRQMMVELRGHLSDIADDDSIRCVVLRGSGKGFGAGRDLADVGAPDTGEWLYYDAETVDALADLPKPTIACIHGYCLTGSLELALGCDLLVAAESARLGDTHGKWGLVPVWGMTVRLTERIGRAKAKDLSFTTRLVPAPEALAMGLIDRCFPDAELERETRVLADQIIASSPGAHARWKALLRDEAAMTRDVALRFERTRPYGVAPDRDERLARGR